MTKWKQLSLVQKTAIVCMIFFLTFVLPVTIYQFYNGPIFYNEPEETPKTKWAWMSVALENKDSTYSDDGKRIDLTVDVFNNCSVTVLVKVQFTTYEFQGGFGQLDFVQSEPLTLLTGERKTVSANLRANPTANEYVPVSTYWDASEWIYNDGYWRKSPTFGEIEIGVEND